MEKLSCLQKKRLKLQEQKIVQNHFQSKEKLWEYTVNR